MNTRAKARSSGSLTQSTRLDLDTNEGVLLCSCRPPFKYMRPLGGVSQKWEFFKDLTTAPLRRTPRMQDIVCRNAQREPSSSIPECESSSSTYRPKGRKSVHS